MKQFINIQRVDSNERYPFLLIVISAVLTMISLTFFDFSFIAWFSQIFILLYFMNNTITSKKAFAAFFVYGIVFNMLYLHWLFNLHPLTWMGYSLSESFILTFLAWFSLSIFEALFYAVFAFFAFISRPKNKYQKGFLVILVFLLVEWSREIDIFGFPWAKLALSQYRNIRLIQTASVLGMIFVSFIILLINFSLASAFMTFCKSKIKTSILFISLALIIFLSNFFYGHSAVNKQYSGNTSFNVSIIQGNIGVSDKWLDQEGETVKEKHFRITREAVLKYPKTQIIFWAETAIPANLTTYPEILDEIALLSEEIDRPLIIGTLLYDEDGGLRNSIAYIDSSGFGDIYHKRHPVPVGEYIPFKEIVFKVFPKAKDSRIASEGLVAGIDSSLIDIDGYLLGALVCYDSIFPQLSREAAADGANFLFVASNDSWYKESSALEQHNAQSVFRAVETRKPMVRAANTGISSIISPTGNIIVSSEANIEYILNSTIYLNDNISTYVKIGNMFLYLIALLYALIVIKGIIQRILSIKK